MTDTSTHQVVCNKCKVALKPVTDSNPECWGCPKCGISDTRDSVLREAGEHVKEMAARHLQDQVRDVAKGASFIKFDGKPIPKGQYRFVTDFKL